MYTLSFMPQSSKTTTVKSKMGSWELSKRAQIHQRKNISSICHVMSSYRLSVKISLITYNKQINKPANQPTNQSVSQSIKDRMLLYQPVKQPTNQSINHSYP